MMARRTQIIVLAVLAVVLIGVLYFQLRRPSGGNSTLAAEFKVDPLPVENPLLRRDLLNRIRRFEYSGRHRNIFTGEVPPEEQPRQEAPQVVPDNTPPAPPPVVVPAKFFGYVADSRTGFRRAFFSDGEEVYILAEGEVLLSRFRLLRITNTTADMEEISSGRRTTLVLEETGQPPSA
jgi:hypothetical protein